MSRSDIFDYRPDVHARTTVGASFVAPSPRPDALDALTADVLAGLRVLNDADHLAERFGVPIPEAQLRDRARNIAMGLWGNYRIECRPGAEPVSAAGGDTEDLELDHNVKGP